VGGWLGLACGASVITFIEIPFFLAYLIKLTYDEYSVSWRKFRSY